MRRNGHAIEVRLCAEDAEQAFMPQSGTMACGSRHRGCASSMRCSRGAEITPHYDSMIAKIVSHGATRDEARRKLDRRSGRHGGARASQTNQAFSGALPRALRCLRPAAPPRHSSSSMPHALLRRDEAADRRAGALAAVLLLETSPGARRDAGRRLVACAADRLRWRDRWPHTDRPR